MPHEVTKKQLAEIKAKSTEWGIKEPFANEWHYVLPGDFVRNFSFQGTLCRWSGKDTPMVIRTYQPEDGRDIDLYIGQCDECGRVYWN